MNYSIANTKTVKIAAAILGLAFAFSMLAAAGTAHAEPITSNLTVGSTGSQVLTLQGILVAGGYLHVAPTGYFGLLTKAAVAAWQASVGLPSTGYFGPLSRAAIGGAVSGNFPAGCTSAAGFSSTTGMSCAAGPSMGLPAGCSSSVGFSPLTGAKCSGGFPAGCTSAVGFSSTTGMSCAAGGSASSNGSLTGGAADVTVTETSTDVEDSVNEGATGTKVNGFKIEADGGDVAVTNVKVSFEADGASDSSFRLNHYIDKVTVWEGSTKVGSADVSDFTKTANVYSKSIALSNAVVREGSSHKGTFYVSVDALENIDSNDFNATWTSTVNNIRFTDSTGVILTAGDFSSGDGVSDFHFTSLSASGDVKVIVSKDSTSPIAQDVTVSDTSTTKNVLMLAFKVKATGSDVTFDTLDITSDFTPADDTASTSDVIGELQLKSGSDTIATLDGSELNDGTATFNLDDTFTVPADTTKTFKIYATVNNIDGFDSGDQVSVSFDAFSPEDSNGDTVDDSGSASGSVQTFVNDVPTLVKVGTPTLALLTHTDGTTSGLEDQYKATIKFDVTAPDNAPVYVPLDTFAYGTSSTAGVQYEVAGGATVLSASVQYSGSDDLQGITEDNTYRIDAGTTQEFTLTVNLKGNDANGKVTLTGFDYETGDSTPDGSPVITAPSNIYTPLLFLAK